MEGLDGCGKSTQSALLADRLGAVLTREPGGTALGARLRQELLFNTEEEVSGVTEVLLYAADRAHHLHNVVQPALTCGQAVVSDRSVWSSVAYQGYGRELGADLVIDANRVALAGRWPDAVVFIDTDTSHRAARMQRELDRIESAGAAFFERAETGFRVLAAQQGWIVVDGDAPVEHVHEEIIRGLSLRFGTAFDALLSTNGGEHENR